MTNSITVVIPGKPIPQERPYVTRYGAFDRPKSKAEKKRIGLLFSVAKAKSNYQTAAGKVRVDVIFSGCNPASDLDNLQKLVLDSLKGIAWKDDKQVYEIHAYKRPGEEEKTTIIVEEI